MKISPKKLRLATLGLGIFLVGALISAGCGGASADVQANAAPTVVSTLPVNGDSSVTASRVITATFSEAMDPASINAASFSVSTAAGPLPGVVTYAGRTATLRLTTKLPTSTLVTGHVVATVTDLSGKPMVGNYTWTFTTSATGDTVPPTVTSTDPASGETGVALNKAVEVVFSEPMDPTTVNATTFTVSGPGGAVAGTVSTVGGVSQFTPTTSFAVATIYTATLSTGVKDFSDNALAVSKVWSFTTGATLDTTPPRILSSDPAANETGVSVNRAVSVTFSEAMDVATLDEAHFYITRPNGSTIPAVLAYASRVAILNPVAAIPADQIITVHVLLGVKDTAGNSIASGQTWSFTTTSFGDVTAPTVLSMNPASGATGVFTNASISATFSEAMDPSTLNTTTFSVGDVNGTVSYDSVNHIATFKPLFGLDANRAYTARIQTGAHDASGNSLALTTWIFTTGTVPTQIPVNLGSATNYAVLAGSSVLNTGLTIINGDLGTSPGNTVTGFPPGIVNGTTHAGDGQASIAKTDFVTAQNYLATRPNGIDIASELSGVTFTPGIYKNAASLTLTAGPVILDAQGNPDAIFIFQVGNALVTADNSTVTLMNGAKATNVFWSVGTSATLGASSVFKGCILADVAITLGAGASNEGNLLTNTGAITLQASSVRSRSKLPH